MRNQLHTYTSCVRIYRAAAVQGLRPANDGFVGVVELLWLIDQRGGTIVEFPATLTVRTAGQSKMRVLRTALAHGWFLLHAASARLFSRPITSTRRQSPVKPSLDPQTP
jgi:hypothetical protein